MIERTTESQPLNSLAAIWRRFTSMSVRYQSPVSRFQPDQCSASASSDIPLSSLDVNVGFDDISAFLDSVEARRAGCRAGWNGPAGTSHPELLSNYGHLIAIDVPKLVELVRVLDETRRHLMRPNV